MLPTRNRILKRLENLTSNDPSTRAQDMKKIRTRWNDDALPLGWKIVHIQDMEISCLGLCLNIIETQEFGDENFLKFLWVLDYTNRKLEDAARQLYNLKDGKPGREPLWMELADQVVMLSLRIKKLFPIIRKERRVNNWTVIEARLRVCTDEIIKLQNAIIKSLPEATTIETYISQRSVAEVLDLIKTLEMTEGSGGVRWRRND